MTTQSALELLQRRVEELISLLAIFSQEVELEKVEPPELAVAIEEGTFEASHFSDSAHDDIILQLMVRALPDAGGSPRDGCSARLCLQLPTGYPASRQLRVLAVTCDALGRDGESQCRVDLQRLADAAAETAGEGRECMCQLVEALLQRLPPPPQPAPHLAAGKPDPQTAAPQKQRQEQQQLALLRLDHMHSRSAYSRTIRRWADELGLSGRLLFCGGSSARPALILILLLGSAEAVKEYLVRQRTRNVDVDSKGRPCRERMMDVVCLTSWPSSSDSGAQAVPSCFHDFREEELGVPQLAALFQAAALEPHWTAATGLPALPQPS